MHIRSISRAALPEQAQVQEALDIVAAILNILEAVEMLFGVDFSRFVMKGETAPEA